MRRVALLTVAAAFLAVGIQADTIPGVPWSCSVDNIGATLTVCKYHPDPSKRLYITDIVASSTTATGGQMLLEYGTGTNCGTGTTALFPSAASAVRFGYPGNASAPAMLRFQTPVIVPYGKDLCVLAVNTNTISLHVVGYISR
jgi:hypothetical protein